MGRDPRLTVAARELASLRAEKTIVLALLIQLFVAAFSSFLVVGLVAMYDPGATGGYSVDLAVAGDETALLEAAASATGAGEVRTYDDPTAAADAFERGAFDAVIVTERAEPGRIGATVTVAEGGVETTLVVVTIRDVLERYERSLRVRRGADLERSVVEPPAEVPASPYCGFTYTVLVPLLLFMPVFVGGSVAVDALAEELERGTFELLRATPATPAQLLEGKLLATAGPVPVQAALWIALLRANGTRIANVGELLVLVAGLAAAVCALGLGVAAATRDRRLAQFLYSTGLLAVFAAALVLPEHPANSVARLAVGSPGPATSLAVAASVALGAVGMGAIRLLPRLVATDRL